MHLSWESECGLRAMIYLVTQDQDTCGNTVASEVLIVNSQNRGLKNAVVFLDRVKKGKRLEDQEIHCPVGQGCLTRYPLEKKADDRHTGTYREASLPQLLSSPPHPLMNVLCRMAFKIRRLQGVPPHTDGPGKNGTPIALPLVAIASPKSSRPLGLMAGWAPAVIFEF